MARGRMDLKRPRERTSGQLNIFIKIKGKLIQAICKWWIELTTETKLVNNRITLNSHSLQIQQITVAYYGTNSGYATAGRCLYFGKSQTGDRIK